MTKQPLSAPADLSVIYEYRAGSMPPPYHNEYTVVVGPGPQGKVIYRPNYPSDATPIWTEPITPTTAQLDSLYALLRDRKLLRNDWRTLGNPPVGGSILWAAVTANGQTYSIPEALDPSDAGGPSALYEFVTSLVPQSIWDSLEARRTQYEDDYRKHQP